MPREALLCQHGSIYTGSIVDITMSVRSVDFSTPLTNIATPVQVLSTDQARPGLH